MSYPPIGGQPHLHHNCAKCALPKQGIGRYVDDFNGTEDEPVADYAMADFLALLGLPRTARRSCARLTRPSGRLTFFSPSRLPEGRPSCKPFYARAATAALSDDALSVGLQVALKALLFVTLIAAASKLPSGRC